MSSTPDLLSTRQHGLEQELRTIAHNATNAEVSGYKGRHVTVHPFTLEGTGKTPDTPTVQYPIEGQTWKDETQGSLERTDRPLQIALRGTGFFALGKDLYTRDGSIVLTREGMLTTASGEEFQAMNGGPIRLPDNTDIQGLRIDRSGRILNQTEEIGQLRVVEFDQPDLLQKKGDNLVDGSAAGVRPAEDTYILQGYIERSNANVITQVARAQDVTFNHHQSVLMKRDFYRLQQQLTSQLAHTSA